LPHVCTPSPPSGTTPDIAISPNPTTPNQDETIEHCGHFDPDLIRYGSETLVRQLQNSTPFTDPQYSLICDNALSMLTAKNSEGKERCQEVKAAGIALLKELVSTLPFLKYKNIMTTLLSKFQEAGHKVSTMNASNATEKKKRTTISLMELYCLGLEVIIDGCQAESRTKVTTTMAKAIMATMKALPTATKLMESCFKTLSDLLKTGGDLLAHEHLNILNLCLSELHSNHSTMRMRTRMCIASECPYLNDVNLAHLTDTLLAQIQPASEGKTSGASVDANVSIEAFSIVASRCGHRLGQWLPVVIPLFLTEIGDVADVSDAMTCDAMCKLRENMCIALSKFAERCPLEVSNIQQGKGMDNVLDKMFQLMAFDPFYNNDDSDDDDSEEDEDEGDDEEDDDEEDDDDDDEDDDDDDEDDASWRVRRQALRVVRAFIQSRPEMLSTMYRRCVGADGGEGAGTLVSRFSERHDQVRVEIIMAVRELFEKSTMRHRALLTINANSALSEVAKDQALRTLKVRVYVVLFFIMVCVVVVWVVWNTVVVGAVCPAPSLLMFLLPFFALKWSSASRAHKLLRQRSDHIVLSDRSSAIMHEVEKILTNKTILKYKKHHVIVRELLVMLKEWLLALGGQMPNAGQWVTTTGSVNVLVRSGVCQGLLQGLLLLPGTVTVFCN